VGSSGHRRRPPNADTPSSAATAEPHPPPNLGAPRGQVDEAGPLTPLPTPKRHRFQRKIAEQAPKAPCTARPELLERRSGWGGGKANALTISLPPLSDDETASVAASVLEQPLDNQAIQKALLARAAGNPLYAEQFARVLAEVGALDELPETVHGIIAARLDGLLPEEKALLQDAAFVGKVFWLGALEAIGTVSRRQAEESMYSLERKEFVQQARRPSVAGEAEYVFRHVLLRDVAYGQIPRPTRAAKHRTAAEWIESIVEDRVTDHAEILAHHYGEAVELFRLAGNGSEAAELEAPFRRFLLMAGDRALQLDVAKAESYYGRALELVPSDHPQRATVLTKAADAALVAGRFAEAETRLEEAISELRAEGKCSVWAEQFSASHSSTGCGERLGARVRSSARPSSYSSVSSAGPSLRAPTRRWRESTCSPRSGRNP
jgi:predicted ATPase